MPNPSPRLDRSSPLPPASPGRRRVAARFAALAALGAAALAAQPLPATAQAQGGFPAREIRLVVPWNAGGANDIAARALADILARDNVRVVVDNVPGATGSIGMQKVASAEPDGYTVGMGTTSTLALIAQGLTPLRSDQFAPLVRVTTDPLALLVQSGGPAADLGGFIEQLKKNPGKITIGSPGNNNLNHIFAVMSGRVAGVDVVMVPYTGGAKVVVDLAAKQLDAAVLKPSESRAQMDAGNVKPIAVFAEQRLAALPDVPTFKEKGFDVFPYGPLVQMSYLVAPAGTPAPVRARLVELFGRAIQSERFRALAQQGGSVVDDLAGDALAREIDTVQKSLAVVGKQVFTTDKKP